MFTTSTATRSGIAITGSTHCGWFATRDGSTTINPTAPTIAMVAGTRGSPSVTRLHAGTALRPIDVDGVHAGVVQQVFEPGEQPAEFLDRPRRPVDIGRLAAVARWRVPAPVTGGGSSGRQLARGEKLFGRDISSTDR